MEDLGRNVLSEDARVLAGLDGVEPDRLDLVRDRAGLGEVAHGTQIGELRVVDLWSHPAARAPVASETSTIAFSLARVRAGRAPSSDSSRVGPRGKPVTSSVTMAPLRPEVVVERPALRPTSSPISRIDVPAMPRAREQGGRGIEDLGLAVLGFRHFSPFRFEHSFNDINRVGRIASKWGCATSEVLASNMFAACRFELACRGDSPPIPS